MDKQIASSNKCFRSSCHRKNIMMIKFNDDNVKSSIEYD